MEAFQGNLLKSRYVTKGLHDYNTKAYLKVVNKLRVCCTACRLLSCTCDCRLKLMVVAISLVTALATVVKMAARFVSNCNRLWRLTRTQQAVTRCMWIGRVVYAPDKVTHTGQVRFTVL